MIGIELVALALMVRAPEGGGDVSAIIAAGVRAEAAQDAQGLLDAAYGLEQTGAHAEGGTPDLARQWRRDAWDLGMHDQTPPWRGRTLGPSYRRGRVAAHASFTTHQSFNAGQDASVGMTAVDGGPLGLSVRDDDGNTICNDVADTRDGECRWTPVWSGDFDISVINYGDSEATYYLVTN